MKQGLILMIFSFTFSSFYAQERINKFSFKSMGRGFDESIIIRQDSTFVTRQTRKDSLNRNFLTSSETWDRLISSINKYSLKDLENLPSPTDNRASDGAMFSYITISTTKKEYKCGEFDSKTPNEKLKSLLTIILESLK